MRRSRTDNIDIVFCESVAVGWVFDMPDSFRQQLDILYTQRIDKKKTDEKRRRMGRKLENSEKVYKFVWTRGEPPAYSFAEGHVFYDPAGVRAMVWAEALKILRRRVQVIEATPDPGAFTQPRIVDEEAEVPRSDADTDKPGRVVFEIDHYLEGQCTQRESMELSQKEFAEFLRTGKTPDACRGAQQDADEAASPGPFELVR